MFSSLLLGALENLAWTTTLCVYIYPSAPGVTAPVYSQGYQRQLTSLEEAGKINPVTTGRYSDTEEIAATAFHYLRVSRSHVQFPKQIHSALLILPVMEKGAL